ncbi:MAG: hypothetical protein FWG50_06710 [Kiritimatiellaeota bacterium]|nr:hypothetical protein [Kiritimatiellota bacterium]
MKRCLPYLLLLLCAACSRVQTKQTKAPPPQQAADIPSEAEIAAFIPLWQDPEDGNKSIRFDVTFGVARLRPQVMDGFRARGKIPFAVSVNFARHEDEPWDDPWGRKPVEDARARDLGWPGAAEMRPQLVRVLRMVNVYSIMDGEAEIAVLDADGNVVDRTRQALGLLCPS